MVTPLHTRNKVIGMHLDRAKTVDIATEFGISGDTALLIIAQYNKEGDCVPKKSCGRLPELGPRAIRVPIEIVEEDPRRPFQEIIKLLKKRIRTTVCKDTVIKALRKEGFALE